MINNYDLFKYSNDQYFKFYYKYYSVTIECYRNIKMFIKY